MRIWTAFQRHVLRADWVRRHRQFLETLGYAIAIVGFLGCLMPAPWRGLFILGGLSIFLLLHQWLILADPGLGSNVAPMLAVALAYALPLIYTWPSWGIEATLLILVLVAVDSVFLERAAERKV